MRATILIIDDDPAISDILCAIIQEAYPEVSLEAVRSGSQGLAAIVRRRPDLVLLDVRMPGQDGLAVLRWLRKLDANVPVIIMSGSGKFGDALQQGVVACVSKPFNHSHIKYLVGTVLAKRDRGQPDEPK